MEGCQVNWNSIIYKKGAVDRTEIERSFLAAKGFNTNLVQFLPLHHVIISNVHVYSFMGTIFHIHVQAPKMVLHAWNLVSEKLYIIMKTWTYDVAMLYCYI